MSQQINPTNLLLIITAIVAMLGTVFATLVMLVFCLAAGANASAESIHRLKMIMLGCTLGSVLCLGVAIWMVTHQRPGTSALVALLPSVVMGATFLVKLMS